MGVPIQQAVRPSKIDIRTLAFPVLGIRHSLAVPAVFVGEKACSVIIDADPDPDFVKLRTPNVERRKCEVRSARCEDGGGEY